MRDRVLTLAMRYQRIGLLLLVGIVLTPFIVMILAWAVIAPNGKYVLNPYSASTMQDHHVRVGIVLGAGVSGRGRPYQELQARLDVAAQAVKDGYVEKLILSGDNRFHNYNEPAAMMRYLLDEKHISAAKLQPDYAGRSTYESCERAAKIFNVQETIIFSAGSHLSRAIFLCRHFGIETYGVSSNVETNNAWRRELLARVKAMYNVYVRGEPTVLGDKIDF